MSQLRGSLGGSSPALVRLPNLSGRLWVAAILVAALAALLPGLWTSLALVGFATCLLLLVRPELAVYLLTLSVPLGSLLEVEWGSIAITPTEGLAALLVLGWIARCLARRSLPIPVTPLTVPLAAMLFILGLSAHQALEPALTLKETLKWLELAMVYIFIITEMSSARQISLLLLMMLAGAAIESVLGFVQFALGIGPDTFAIGPFMRAYGTFEQPNPYAGYLGMLIPLGAGYLLSRPAFKARVYVLLSCLMAATAVMMSLSRGAWVGIGLALALMMLLWSRRSLLVLTAGLLAATPLAGLALLNLLPYEISSRLATALDYFRFVDVREEVVNPQNWAVLERVAHWQAALGMIADHPLSGVGAGNYPAAYEGYQLRGWDEPLGHAHNYYLNLAAEIGIPGLLVYLWLMVAAFSLIVKGLVLSGRRDLTPRPPLPRGEGEKTEAPPRGGEGLGAGSTPSSRRLWRGILLGTLGALVASSLHNMFDNLFVHSMSVQLGMILALAQTSANVLSPRVPIGARPRRGKSDLEHAGEPPLSGSPRPGHKNQSGSKLPHSKWGEPAS